MKYIVKVRKGNDPHGVAKGHGLKPKHVFDKLVNGFVAELTDAQVEALQRNPHVEAVEEDGEVEAYVLPWGLDRVDQRTTALDGVYSAHKTGKGVPVYIVDTGIRRTHQEFGGRAVQGWDGYGGDSSDLHGHGTHCAGTVGGNTVGVAREVKLVAVRVLNENGFGDYGTVIAGLEWIATQPKGVVSMSLGGPRFDLLNDAIRALVGLGYVVVVAAGNSNDDAVNYSPASTPEALTVGATFISPAGDERAGYSNWGDLLDIFAPGSGIVSAYKTSDSSYAEMSGTSMACPHVAGACALALEETPGATPAEIRERIQRTATQGVVKDADRQPAMRDLLYSRMDSEQPPDTPVVNMPPKADFVWGPGEGTSAWFRSTSADPENNIIRYQWAFGDGHANEGNTETSHAYVSPGRYSVQHTVTDAELAKAFVSKDITVGDTEPEPEPEPPPSVITLTVTTTNAKGQKTDHLAWSGARGETVDVYRDGVRFATVPNNGVRSFGPRKGKAPSYRVCETGGSVCSATVSL